MKKTMVLALALSLLGACSSGSSDGGADVGVGSDAASDALAEVFDTGEDPGPVDVGHSDDTSADVAAPCEEGAWECSADARTLTLCEEGAWTDVDCAASSALCEDGQCVPQWAWGSPQWGTCPDPDGATTETLAEKAAYYDDIATRLHIHPDLKWIAPVTLPRVEVECSEGKVAPCYEPAVDEAVATYEDVEAFSHGENDGLWSSLYLASQAFRYAATGSEEALGAIRTLLDGEVARMAVTGVPGVFTREMIPPEGVPGVSCPSDDAAYVTDVEKDDNKWVQIREDGCAWVIPNETMEWTKTDHCGLDDYAGWCFLDNVSQDEYAGHMLALGVVMALVDVPDVQATVRDLLGQVGRHLYENDLTFVDWDGRVTEHGKLYPTALVNAPGYLAIESMNWILLAAEATGDEELIDFYDNCLLQRDGRGDCLPWPLERGEPFTNHFDIMLLYIDGPGDAYGCLSNWNNFSMMMANLHTLVWYETNPETHAILESTLDAEVMRPDHPLALIVQQNPWFNFIWASQKALGPDSDGPAYDAVEDAICGLKQFPASKARQAKDPSATYDYHCTDRLDDPLTDEVIPVHERCTNTFLWWRNPYDIEPCSGSSWRISPPTDYLLAYWMGRYYGFIPEDM